MQLDCRSTRLDHNNSDNDGSPSRQSVSSSLRSSTAPFIGPGELLTNRKAIDLVYGRPVKADAVPSNLAKLIILCFLLCKDYHSLKFIANLGYLLCRIWQRVAFAMTGLCSLPLLVYWTVADRCKSGLLFTTRQPNKWLCVLLYIPLIMFRLIS
jgi:hypothetical protein